MAVRSQWGRLISIHLLPLLAPPGTPRPVQRLCLLWLSVVSLPTFVATYHPPLPFCPVTTITELGLELCGQKLVHFPLGCLATELPVGVLKCFIVFGKTQKLCELCFDDKRTHEEGFGGQSTGNIAEGRWGGPPSLLLGDKNGHYISSQPKSPKMGHFRKPSARTCTW